MLFYPRGLQEHLAEFSKPCDGWKNLVSSIICRLWKSCLSLLCWYYRIPQTEYLVCKKAIFLLSSYMEKRDYQSLHHLSRALIHLCGPHDHDLIQLQFPSKGFTAKYHHIGDYSSFNIQIWKERRTYPVHMNLLKLQFN